MLVARMGWRTFEGIRFTIGEYSVRLGSALQHDQVRQRRAEAHRLFVAEAVGRAPNSAVVAEEMQRLTETLTKWENTHKEAYWRLTVDGIPPAGQLAHAAGGACAVWVRGEARPRRIAGYAPTAPLLGVPGGPSRRGAGGTQAGNDDHQGQQSNACGIS